MPRTLGWAIYLACSWTWCIGMFLPSLLIRDGGVPFFWAFIIPNVIGAASVGWVLSNAERSRRFVASLRPILLVFTAVTIGFHAYWLTWRAGEWIGRGQPEVLAGMIGAGLVVMAAVAARRRVDWMPAVVTLFFTFTLGVILLSRPATSPPGVLGFELVGLAMVTVLGFGLCPYLDLSFNHAAQRAKNPRGAFTLGFFVVFAVIILVATRGRVVWSPDDSLFAVPDWALLTAIGCHFGAQATFTVAAHVSSMRHMEPVDGECSSFGRSPCILRYAVMPAAAGVVLALGAFVMTAKNPYDVMPVMIPYEGLNPMPGHELLYRMFLGCYGLVFPVWMLLSLGGRNPVSRRTLSVLVVACLLAAPFYWIGTIERHETWLIPGVCIVLLARLFVGRPVAHDSAL